MSKYIDKYIDLSGLPKTYRGIDWKNSIGFIIPFKYGNISDVIEIIENVNCDKVNIKYKDNIYEMNKDCIKRCALAYVVGNMTRENKYIIGEKVKVNSGYITILQQIRIKDKNNSLRGYLVKCNNDDHEYMVTEYNLKGGHGCPLCTNQVVVKGINDMATVYPTSLEYVLDINDAYLYTYKSEKIIMFKCPNCGFEKKMRICDFQGDGFSCNRCSDGISYPNKFAFSMLEQFKIDFISEYSPDWIKPRKFDFYFELNNKKYIVEMDGGWHGTYNNLSGKTKEESISDDNYKENEAKKHDINVIRIKSNISRMQNIVPNIINSELSKLFDLSNIDWEKCEKFTCNSFVKTACDYWNNGIHSCYDISKIMKMSSNTICRYLKKGSNISLCDYTVEKAEKIKNEKARVMVYQTKTRPITCLETGHVFGSIILCQRNSIDVFGSKIWTKSLSDVLTGKHKHTHHLHFKYITRDEFNITKKLSPETSFGEFFIATEPTPQSA